jgi:hypothetical protein
VPADGSVDISLTGTSRTSWTREAGCRGNGELLDPCLMRASPIVTADRNLGNQQNVINVGLASSLGDRMVQSRWAKLATCSTGFGVGLLCVALDR